MLADVLAALDDVSAATLTVAAERFDELARAEAGRTPWARWGRMGTRIDRLVTSSYTATLRVVGSPAGIWAWAERGIRPHTITRKSAGRGRNRGGAARGRRTGGRRRRPDVLAIVGDHPVAGPLHHPGFHRAGRAWSTATDALEDELPRLALDALDRVGL